MGEAINTGDIKLWTERRGHGPDVLLIAGLGDPAEAWQPQLERLSDRYLLTAFDNRGVRWSYRVPTSLATRWEAPSPRRWPFGTPSSSAVSSS
jgi:pimeloyl-ACP methyl ester carboxylesterase